LGTLVLTWLVTIGLIVSCADDVSTNQAAQLQEEQKDNQPNKTQDEIVLENINQSTSEDARPNSTAVKIKKLAIGADQQATLSLTCSIQGKPCPPSLASTLELAYKLSDEEVPELALTTEAALTKLFTELANISLVDALWEVLGNETIITVRIPLPNEINSEKHIVIMLRSTTTSRILTKAEAKITTKKGGMVFFDAKGKAGFMADRKHYQSSQLPATLIAEDMFSPDLAGASVYLYNETDSGKTLFDEKFTPNAAGKDGEVSFHFAKQSAKFFLTSTALKAGKNRLTLFIDKNADETSENNPSNQFATLELTWRDFFIGQTLSTVASKDISGKSYAPVGWFSSYSGASSQVATQFEPMMFQ
jgi:hypothetical protein